MLKYSSIFGGIKIPCSKCSVSSSWLLTSAVRGEGGGFQCLQGHFLTNILRDQDINRVKNNPPVPAAAFLNSIICWKIHDTLSVTVDRNINNGTAMNDISFSEFSPSTAMLWWDDNPAKLRSSRNNPPSKKKSKIWGRNKLILQGYEKMCQHR